MKRIKNIGVNYFKAYREAFCACGAVAAVFLLGMPLWGLFPAVENMVLQRLFGAAGTAATDGGALLVTLGVLFFVLFLTDFLLGQLLGRVQEVQVIERFHGYLRRKVAEKIQQTPLELAETQEFATVQRRGFDSATRIPIMIGIPIVAVRCLVEVISVSLVLCTYSPWFLGIVCITVLPSLITYIVRGNAFYRLNWVQSAEKRKLDYFWNLHTDKSAVKDMRVFGSTRYFKTIWQDLNGKIVGEVLVLNKKEATAKLFCDVLKVIGLMLAISLAVSLVTVGQIDFSRFAAAVMAFLTLQASAEGFCIKLSQTWTNAQYVQDYFTFMEQEVKAPIALQGAQTAVGCALQGVSYQYPYAKTCVLQDISFSIAPGEKVVVIGENGSGKTTLIKLLCGMYRPTTGKILQNGRLVEQAGAMAAAAVVTQNFTKYKLTLRENVLLEGDKTQDEKIASVFETIGFSEFLQQHPLDTPVGTEFGGADFSGGQWQKIAIARALCDEQAGLIILDEPTSALDPISETEVMRALLDHADGKTTVIVTHRVGICKYADKILFMDQGRLIGSGTHKELLLSNAQYASLFNRQSKWYVE